MSTRPEQRDATQDGNAGYVSQPSIKHTPLSQAPTKTIQMSGTSAALNNAAKGLGNAFGKYVEHNASNAREQAKLSGVAAAGMKKSMDEVDVDVKQSGFTDFIFGEDVEYKQAQQQVITNGVEAAYREELARIDSYQGYTEREYGQVLRDRLDSLGTMYKDDQETKALATDAWIKGAGKLVDKQHKTHFAFKQNEMRRISRETIMGRMDQMAIEEQEVTSPQDEVDYNNAWDSMFSSESRSKGMTEGAHKSQLAGILLETLVEGNITPYKQARLRKFWKKASPEDIASLDRAIGKYDVKYGYKVNTTIEGTAAALSSVANVNDAMDMMDKLDSDIGTHETRQAGSVKGKNIIAEARSRAAAMRERALTAGVTAEKKTDDLNSVKASLRKQPDEWGADKGASAWTKKLIDQGASENFTEDLGNITGKEIGSAQDAVKLFMTDTTVAQAAIPKWAGANHVVPALKEALVASMNGLDGFVDEETGFPNNDFRQIMTTTSEMNRINAPLLRKQLGADGYKRFSMYRAGMRGNRPAAKMIQDADKVMEGLKNKSLFTNSVALQDGQNKRDFIIQKLKIPFLGIDDQTKFVGYFDEGMALNGGDPDLAAEYVETMYRTQETQVGNILIPRSGELSAELGAYDLKTVLTYIQGDKDLGREFLKPFAGKWYDNPRDADKNPHEFSQIPGLRMEPAIGGAGLWVSSPSGASRLIPTSKLVSVSHYMGNQERQNKAWRERQAKQRQRRDLDVASNYDLGTTWHITE